MSLLGGAHIYTIQEDICEKKEKTYAVEVVFKSSISTY